MTETIARCIHKALREDYGDEDKIQRAMEQMHAVKSGVVDTVRLTIV